MRTGLLVIAAALMPFIGSAAERSDQRLPVIAQNSPGNVGGVIGRPNKSLSDDGVNQPPTRQTPARPSRPARQSDALPQSIQLTDHTIVGVYTVMLRKVGGNRYSGTWSSGVTTSFVVTMFSQISLSMRRSDGPGIGSVTGSYTGTRSGKSASGSAAFSIGTVSKWEATW